MKPRLLLARLCDLCLTSGSQRALTAFRRYYLLKNKLGDRMIKQLLNSVIVQYRDLSVSRRSIICLSLQHRQIIDLLATDKSRYFAQPRPIFANFLLSTCSGVFQGVSSCSWFRCMLLISSIQLTHSFL